MANSADARGLVAWLVGASLGLLTATVAVDIAVSLVRTILPWLAMLGVTMLLIMGWRTWSRRLW
jgi:hypothetical protein